VQPLATDEYLRQLRSATADLIQAIGGLPDAGATAPSLLPGWTRGHVLTHLARNADGGARLLGWARTGVPSYEYESVAARAAEIEQGAHRPAAVLIKDVRNSADAPFLAWLLRRSDGAGLARDGDRPLPEVPTVYAT
jgi:uncharacterized protein (TIGR03083 family)